MGFVRQAGRLIRWLLSFFVKRNERLIFRFFDGSEYRYIDPLEVFRVLEACKYESILNRLSIFAQGVSIESDTLKKQLGDPMTISAELADVARKAFGVAKVSSQGGKVTGLSDLECCDLLTEFIGWSGDLMEEFRPFLKWPISSPDGSERLEDTGEYVPLGSAEKESAKQ